MKFHLLGLATAALGAAATRNPMSAEHAGGVFSRPHSRGCGVQGVLHGVEPRGSMQTCSGETLYVTQPPRGARMADVAVLYLTDIFGLGIPNNKLLADSIASAGYLVVAPDLFRGDPVPGDARDPGSEFDLEAWRTQHPEEEVDGIIATAIETMREEYGATKLGAVGYCFGAPYVARLLSPGGIAGAADIVEAGFIAHPSSIKAYHWAGISKPISVAYGDQDDLVPQELRREAEDELVGGNEVRTFEISLYGGAEHGFAVRTDLSDPTKAFAQESAYYQAVRWMDAWITGGE